MNGIGKTSSVKKRVKSEKTGEYSDLTLVKIKIQCME